MAWWLDSALYRKGARRKSREVWGCVEPERKSGAAVQSGDLHGQKETGLGLTGVPQFAPYCLVFGRHVSNKEASRDIAAYLQ